MEAYRTKNNWKKKYRLLPPPQKKNRKKKENPRMSKKFYNILVCARFWCMYQMSGAVQTLESTHWSW